tara:strand:- start:273 stop:629 length:357 start_codon:yes stop_codon:yes gene_type:complete
VRARVLGLEGTGEERGGHLGGGGVGGGGGDITEGVALREVVEDDLVQGLHEVQCGELLVQLDEEFALEGVLVALRHLWARVWVWTRSGLLSDHKGPHAYPTPRERAGWDPLAMMMINS